MADGQNFNLTLWNDLAPVDRSFTKPITGKSYKGDSPNPTYIIWKLTQAMGPIGQGWGFNVKFDRVRQGAPHQIITGQSQEFHETQNEDGTPRLKSKSVSYEVLREELHEVCITFWFKGDDGQVKTFDAYGGTKMLYKTSKGHWMADEDAAKKSLTDAYTKGASWLGACADIFLGLFDDKYSGVCDSAAHGSTGNGAQQQQQQKQSNENSAPPDQNGWGEKQPKQPDTQRQNSAPEGW